MVQGKDSAPTAANVPAGSRGMPDSYLTGEIVGPTTLRRIHAAVWGTLLLVVAANMGVVWLLASNPLNHGYRVIAAKWRLLGRQERPVDWLALGDSSGNQGVVPGILSERLGGTALNLCTVGALLAAHDAWMLESYIEKVGPPRHVILVHAYDIWHRGKNVDAMAQVPLPLGYWNRRQPALRLTAAEVGRVILDRYVPLYSQDQTLSRLIQTPGKILGRSFDMDERGFLSAPRAIPGAVRDDAAGHRELVSKNRFAMSPENLAALATLAALARRHGFDVDLANGPVYSGLYEDPAFRAYYRDLWAYLGEFASKNPQFHVLTPEPVTFPADEMTNADHLIASAAERYTETLASAISSVERAAPARAAAQ